jgi:hypothetical protein
MAGRQSRPSKRAEPAVAALGAAIRLPEFMDRRD